MLGLVHYAVQLTFYYNGEICFVNQMTKYNINNGFQLTNNKN